MPVCSYIPVILEDLAAAKSRVPVVSGTFSGAILSKFLKLGKYRVSYATVAIPSATRKKKFKKTIPAPKRTKV